VEKLKHLRVGWVSAFPEIYPISSNFDVFPRVFSPVDAQKSLSDTEIV
jgi:hypothetical protein